MSLTGFLAGKTVLVNGGTQGPGRGIALAAATQRAVAAFGRVDVVVNATGTTTRGSLLDTSEELFDLLHVAINPRAPFFARQEAVSHLRGRGAGDDWGRKANASRPVGRLGR